MDESTRALIEDLKAQGYRHIVIKNGEICGLYKFAYTWAIISGMNAFGYEGRWCYHNLIDAIAAFDKWNGIGDPEGWYRDPTTGRRRHENGKETTN